MNEFTKDELITLKNGIQYLSDRTSLRMQYVDKCEIIERKIQSLIDNYCDHDNIARHAGRLMHICNDCGVPI